MTKIIDELSFVDEIQTRKNGKKILENYQHLKLIAGKEFTPKVTPDYSLEPVVTGLSSETPIERHVIKKEDSIAELVNIANAINQVDEMSKKILIKKYVADDLVDKLIWVDLHINPTTFYRLLNKALYRFTVAFKSGEEISYKESKVEVK